MALSIAVVVFLLGIAELATRSTGYEPRYLGEAQRWDPELGFHIARTGRANGTDDRGPFVYYRNELGYRGREYPAEGASKDPDVERILFLGDSFTQAAGVAEDRYFPTVAEAVLLAAGKRVEVYTASSNGYGQPQEILLARRLVDRLQPDVICLVMFPHNDVANNYIGVAGASPISAGDYVRPYFDVQAGEPRVTYVHPWRAFWRRNSRLFAYTEFQLLTKRWIRVTEAAVAMAERHESGLAPTEYLELYWKEPQPRWIEAMRETERLVLQLRDECRAWGAELCVGVIPARMQVQKDYYTKSYNARLERGGYAPIPEALDLSAPEEWLEGFLGREGIDVVTFLEPLRERANELGRSLYLADGHLNGYGQEVVGRSFAELLLADGPTAHPPKTQPVDLLNRNGRSGLDFMRETYGAHLVSGWSYFASRKDAEGREAMRGWIIKERRGALEFSGDAGLLVVRGHLESQAPGPYFLHVTNERFDLEQPGFFEIRKPIVAQAGTHHLVLKANAQHTLLLGQAQLASPRVLLQDHEDLRDYHRLKDRPLDELIKLLETECSKVRKALEAFIVPMKGAALKGAPSKGAPSERGRIRTQLSQLLALRNRIEGLVVAIIDQLGTKQCPPLFAGFTSLRNIDRQVRQRYKSFFARIHDGSPPLLERWALRLDDVQLLEAALAYLPKDHAPQTMARLSDRFARRQGRPQPYGTEAVWIDGAWQPWMSVPPEELASNRSGLGLAPLDEARKAEARRLGLVD